MPLFTTDPAILLLCAILGYLMGTITFGVLLARVMGLGNLRNIGSGNIGATNVLRTGSKTAAAATLVLDGGKGALAAILATVYVGSDAAQIAGFAALVGHCFPVWLGFRGGKGVATFLGLMLTLHWPAGLACCASWLLIALISRLSSLAALGAALSAILWVYLLGQPDLLVVAALTCALVFWRHRDNIKRIMAGQEPKIGRSSKDP